MRRGRAGGVSVWCFCSVLVFVHSSVSLLFLCNLAKQSYVLLLFLTNSQGLVRRRLEGGEAEVGLGHLELVAVLLLRSLGRDARVHNHLVSRLPVGGGGDLVGVTELCVQNAGSALGSK